MTDTFRYESTGEGNALTPGATANAHVESVFSEMGVSKGGKKGKSKAQAKLEFVPPGSVPQHQQRDGQSSPDAPSR